jgi:hypothetical protein
MCRLKTYAENAKDHGEFNLCRLTSQKSGTKHGTMQVYKCQLGVIIHIEQVFKSRVTF